MTRAEIEQLKQTVPMEALLEALGFEVGKNNRTRCILHGGDNPTSFSYTDDRFHCFACGATGDKIDLTMQARNCSFEEGVEFLQQLANGNGKAVAPEALAHRSNLFSLIRRMEDGFDSVDAKVEEDLRCDWQVNEERFRKGEIAPCEYYTRQHIIDEEFGALDARRIERK